MHKQVAKMLAFSIRPRKKRNVWQCVDEERYLPEGSTSEPGLWRTDRTPFLREIMEVMSPDHPCTEVVVLKGAQMGVTEAAQNLTFYTIRDNPQSIAWVFPTKDIAADWSRQRLSKLLASIPELAGFFEDEDKRKNKEVNTVFYKEFPGGSIRACGANVAAHLKSWSAPIIIMDEFSEHPIDVEGQGSSDDLVKARARTYPNRKIVYISTPTNENCQTTAKFLKSDQRHLYVPCPSCDTFQEIVWESITWIDNDPSTTRWNCNECGTVHGNERKTEMIMRGEWRPHNPKSSVPGFYLPSLYAPVGRYDWQKIVEEYIEADGDPIKMKAIENTVFGRTWKDGGDAPEWQRLFERAGEYEVGIVPDDVCVLTAGADVQKDRVEIEVIGWGPGLESWSVDYKILYFNTANVDEWGPVADYLARPVQTESGHAMQIAKVALDTGYRAQEVYRFIRQYSQSKVMGVKGQDSCKTTLGRATAVDLDYGGKRITRGAVVWSVGSSTIKSEIYGWLRLTRNEDLTCPPGYCHFPNYGAEYFEMLTAETLVEERNRRGYLVPVWKKMRDRNEALDTRVYARAAVYSIGADMWSDEEWKEARGIVDIPIIPDYSSRDSSIGRTAKRLPSTPIATIW